MKNKYILRIFFICFSLLFVKDISLSLNEINAHFINDYTLTAAKANTNNLPNDKLEKARTTLMNALAHKMEGKAIMDSGASDIVGQTCPTFKYGKNTPERFVTIEHLAVCPNGTIYKMDIISADWVIYPTEK